MSGELENSCLPMFSGYPLSLSVLRAPQQLLRSPGFSLVGYSELKAHCLPLPPRRGVGALTWLGLPRGPGRHPLTAFA